MSKSYAWSFNLPLPYYSLCEGNVRSGCEYNKSKKYNIPNIGNTEATQSGPGQTFKRAHFALKRKNSFDLHISSQIDKIIKKLQ